jgi:hypothetical protein
MRDFSKSPKKEAWKGKSPKRVDFSKLYPKECNISEIRSLNLHVLAWKHRFVLRLTALDTEKYRSWWNLLIIGQLEVQSGMKLLFWLPFNESFLKLIDWKCEIVKPVISPNEKINSPKGSPKLEKSQYHHWFIDIFILSFPFFSCLYIPQQPPDFPTYYARVKTRQHKM